MVHYGVAPFSCILNYSSHTKYKGPVRRDVLGCRNIKDLWGECGGSIQPEEKMVSRRLLFLKGAGVKCSCHDSALTGGSGEDGREQTKG